MRQKESQKILMALPSKLGAMMTIKTIVRFMVWLMLLVLPATASAFCTRTVSWTEDVLLHDGRVIKIDREVCSTFQFIAGDGGSMKLFASWPDKFWLKFKNPDTNEIISWQGEQYFNPVLLDFVEGVPYLVVMGRPDMETEEIYGCPELPYIYLKYEKKGLWGGKWSPVSVEQAPVVLRDANLSQDEVSLDKHKHATLHSVHTNIRKVEGSSAEAFQAKLPRSYDDWHNSYKNSYRNERRMNDCRPPRIQLAPVIMPAATEASAELLDTINYSPERVETGEDWGRLTFDKMREGECKKLFRPADANDYMQDQRFINDRSGSKRVPYSSNGQFQMGTRVICDEYVWFVTHQEEPGKMHVTRYTSSGDFSYRISFSKPEPIQGFVGYISIPSLRSENGYLYFEWMDFRNIQREWYIKRILKMRIREPQAEVLRTESTQSANHRKESVRVAQPIALRKFRDCPTCPEMVAIPDKDYAIGKYEVTQAEWDAVMESRARKSEKYILTLAEWDAVVGSRQPKMDLNNNPDQPATFKDWNEVQHFIAVLNKMTGKKYRLPTEDEWIFACHAGSEMDFCGSNDFDKVGWSIKSSKSKIQAVGQKSPNAYGLFDMSGNAWEWIGDCWKGNCDVHIVRGGSYMTQPLNVENAYMYGTFENDVGFRLVRTLDDSRDDLIPEKTILEHSSFESAIAACACSVGVSIEECEQRCAR